MIASFLKALAVFVLLGPLFGFFGLLIPGPAPLSLAVSKVHFIPFCYIFGGIPALFTGVIAWRLRARFGRWSGALLCSIAGAATASVFLFAVLGQMQAAHVLRLGVFPGAFAGLACGLIYYWPPNQSFKPTPLRGAA